MTIEQVLHQRWADTAELSSLVSPDDVLTGRSHSERPWWVTIHRRGDRPLLRTNSAELLRELLVVFTVEHADYESALAVAEAITAAFDRSAFTVDENSRVLSMQLSEQVVDQGDDHWEISQTFRLVVSVVAGDGT